MKTCSAVFISYRRDGGAEMARLIRDGLTQRGFRVFMDVEDLKSGRFDVALLREIDACTDVLVILSPGSMERCRNEGDWVRREVAYAISHAKNVVTVRTRGFQWPQEPLPEEIKDLPYLQGIEPSHMLFSASVDKLVTLLKSRPSRQMSGLAWVGVAAACAVVAGLVWAAAAIWAGRGQQGGQAGVQFQVPRAHGPLNAATNDATTQDSNFVFARDLCFRQDQWKDGIPLLAKSPGIFQEPAAAEISPPANGRFVEKARLWVKAAQSVSAPDRWHCYRRARYWYQKAAENPLLNEVAKTAAREEMRRIPARKASLRLSGTSPFRERLVVTRTSMNWSSEEEDGGQVQISGVKTLFPFATTRLGSRSISEDDTHSVLPEEVDFLTAKVGDAHFAGTTGSVSEVLVFRIFPDASGFELRFGEKDAARVRYPGSFDFNIVITFGE